MSTQEQDDATDAVWQRFRASQHSVVIGKLGTVPTDLERRVVRVDCSAIPATLGPLLEARRRVEQLLQRQERPLFDSAADQLRAALRRRLLGDAPESERGGVFIATYNRLASEGDGGLVFDAIEDADAATVQWLSDVLARKGWLRAPVVIVHRSAQPQGDALRLMEIVREFYGTDAIVSAPGVDGPAGEPEWSADVLERLPSGALRVLRAASMEGALFDAGIVAELLAADEIEVLEQLQLARDEGVPIADLGRGRFRLPTAAAEELMAGTLPSLAEAWHRRLARILGDPAAPSIAAPAIKPPDEDEDSTKAMPAGPETPTTRLGRRLREDPAKAAQHASAAGESDVAAEQYVAAADRAAAMGAYQDAFTLTKNALELLHAQPVTGHRRLLRVRALTTLARIQWQTVGPSELFSLPAALSSLEEARELLVEDDPVTVRAELGSLIGSICYDIGSKDALERALTELSTTSRELLDADEPVSAARLLNDEAAVWVRLGDVVRANHLLKKSREIFARLTPESEVARQELAETDHLLARLILHTAAKPGREEDAVQVGVEHALAAEEAYRSLSRPRELARVWETLGRLEMSRGRTEAAIEHLEAAARAQQQIGDVLGLARTTAALSDLLANAGRTREALGLLGESIAFNLDKGSPLGLAFNRAALDGLEGEVGAGDSKQAQFLATLRSRVAAGEKILGRAEPPPHG